MAVWLCWAMFLRGGSPQRGPWGAGPDGGGQPPGVALASSRALLGRLAAWGCVGAEGRVGSTGSVGLSPPGAEPAGTARKDWAGWDGAMPGLWRPAVPVAGQRRRMLWPLRRGQPWLCVPPAGGVGAAGAGAQPWGSWGWGGRRRRPTLTSRLFSPIAPLASQWQMIVSTAAPCLSVCLSAVCRSWPRRFLSCVAARALLRLLVWSTSVVPILVLPAWHRLPAGPCPWPQLGLGGARSWMDSWCLAVGRCRG